MRFIATADWQLGMTASYLSDEARPRFTQARLEAIRAIGVLAAEREAELVLVCGDVFESNQLDRQIVLRAFEALKQIAVPVYLLPGNHDPLDASSIYRSSTFVNSCPDHVHVLTEPGVTAVRPGVEIVAAPWFTKRPLTDLVADACDGLEPAPGVVRVVAGHGATDRLSPDQDSLVAIVEDDLRAVLDSGRAQVAILGDRHSTTKVADRIWYPGAPEVTSRREVDPGNVLVVDVEGASIGVETVRVGRWVYRVQARELTSVQDVDDLIDWIDEQPDKELTALWLQLSGTLSVRDKARLDDALDDRALLFALLALWQRHYDLSVVPDDHDFGDLGLTGFADDAVQELIGLTTDENQWQSAQDALGLLYRLTGGGR